MFLVGPFGGAFQCGIKGVSAMKHGFLSGYQAWVKVEGVAYRRGNFGVEVLRVIHLHSLRLMLGVYRYAGPARGGKDICFIRGLCRRAVGKHRHGI